MTFAVRPGDALLVIDVQYDFLPGGRLAVAGGFDIIPIVNALGRRCSSVLMTQDWHPQDHVSFASNHPGRQPFEVIELPYGPQVLWPDHCTWGSRGAQLADELDLPHAQLIVRKGYNREVDSYSAFREADRTTPTGLEGYVRERGLQRLFLCGLATDFCVAWSALDARSAGFETYVIEDACRAIDTNGSLAKAWSDMNGAGVKRIASTDIA